MMIKASGCSALILATGLWVVCAGPSQAAGSGPHGRRTAAPAPGGDILPDRPPAAPTLGRRRRGHTVLAAGAGRAERAQGVRSLGAAGSLVPAGAVPALAWRHLALWLAVTLLIFAPIGLYFADHAKELNSRAAFVFLFSDTQYNTRAEKLQIYTGTQDVPTALLVQVERYATLPRWREPRFGLLLLWLILTIFIGGVLTIESPFTPRLIGVMPVPFMLAAVALEQVYVRVRAQLDAPASAGLLSRAGLRWSAAITRLARWAPAAVVIVLLAASVYWNYWAYFERYIHSIDGWAQREPATAIARYAEEMQPDQTLYVLSQPDLFIWHGTIRFVAPNVRGADVLDPANDLPIRDTLTRRASFVMLPNHVQWLELLRILYPHGEYKQFRRASGELWYAIYEVSEAEIAAAR